GIGVPIEWRAAAPTEGAQVIRVILLPYETGVLHHAPDTVMGVAVSTDDRTRAAYVFYRRVQAEADRYATSTIQVLACAIAHEIGHLLMPNVPHSSIGLMRARWYRDDFSRADQGQLRFLPEQIAAIRAGADGQRVQSSTFRVPVLVHRSSSRSSSSSSSCSLSRSRSPRTRT